MRLGQLIKLSRFSFLNVLPSLCRNIVCIGIKVNFQKLILNILKLYDCVSIGNIA